MLECVINISEGTRSNVIVELKKACSTGLLDIHVDPDHNRSVFTIAGTTEAALTDARALTTKAIELIDLRTHTGVHPRIGVVDVVPFVPLPETGSTIETAMWARTQFAQWLSTTHHVGSYFYDNTRSLPDARKAAARGEIPTLGPHRSHPSAGYCAVGARDVLIAYNLWLETPDLGLAKRIANDIRRPGLRTLGLQVKDHVQVSCNLTDPRQLGPDVAYDLVAEHTAVRRSELVGLIPGFVLDAINSSRWAELDIRPENTIEARLG